MNEERWKTLLLILGSPIWLPLIIALSATAITLIASFYVTLFFLAISLFAVEISLAASGLGAIGLALFNLAASSNTLLVCLLFAGALLCMGLSLILFYPSILAIKGIAKLVAKISLGIKSLIVRKEEQK
jgi:hypothetical protein